MTQQKEFEKEVIEEFEKSFMNNGLNGVLEDRFQDQQIIIIKNFLLSKLSLQHKKDIEWFKSITPNKLNEEEIENQRQEQGAEIENYVRGFNDCREQILKELDKK